METGVARTVDKTRKIGDWGTLEDALEPSCPNCGESLGYYAEFGNEVICKHCGAVLRLEKIVSIDYVITNFV